MHQQQKEKLLQLMKAARENRDYGKYYLTEYEEYLNSNESFTDFNCERGEGKLPYKSLIEKIINADEHAKIYVELYGFEEQPDDTFIYADTLIIFSRLPYEDINRLLNEPSDIFPSETGELENMTEVYTLVKDGSLYPISDIVNPACKMYFCWWD